MQLNYSVSFLLYMAMLLVFTRFSVECKNLLHDYDTFM